MKTRIILIAVTVLMLSSFTNISAQNAIEDICHLEKFQQVQISYDTKDMFTVEYLDALAEGPWKMKVRIYNETGKLLYTRILRKKGNSRVGYDISQLPEGNYTVELYKKNELVCSKDIVKQDGIAANEEAGLEFDKSKFNQVQVRLKGNEMVHLEYLDIFREGRRKMEVRIYEESGELLYSNFLVRNGDVKIDFDISQFPDGNYTFELYKGNESICSEQIVKDAGIVNEQSNLFANKDSNN